METREKIKKLVDECAAAAKETERMETMVDEIDQEDRRLLPTLDLDNPEQFKNLSNLRLRRDIAESKIPQLQTRFMDLLSQLKPTVYTGTVEFNRALGVKVESYTRELAQKIEPYVFDPAEAYRNAGLIVRQTKGPVGLLIMLERDPGSDMEPIQLATALLSAWDQLELASKKGP